MKFGKTVGLLCLEVICIFAGMLILITLIVGGIRLPFGLSSFTSTNIERPLVVLILLLGLKKLIRGSFFGNWYCLTLLNRRRKIFTLPLDALVGSMIILLTLSGLLSYVNPIQRGLIGVYYDNPDWEGPAILTRPDMSFGRRTYTFPQLSEDYSVTWKGAIYIPVAGEYEFATISRDASKILIDHQVIVENNGENELQKIPGTIRLGQGFHAIGIQHRYTDTPGGPVLKAYMRKPGKRSTRLALYTLFQAPLPKAAFVMGQALEIAASVCTIVFMVLSGLFVMDLLSRIARLSLRSKKIVSAVVLFLLVFIAHSFWSPVHTPFDSGWTVYTATSLIAEGNLDLDEFQTRIDGHDHRVIRDHGHFYDRYPPGTPLLSVPFVYILNNFLKHGISVDLIRVFQGNVEKGIAAALVAIVTVIVFLMCGLCLTQLHDVIVLTLVFAFCTSAWSTASRALWQHAANMLVLSLALYFFLQAQRSSRHTPWFVRLTGVVLAYSFLARPTNIVAILPFTAYVALRYRKHLLEYLLWSGTVAVPFILLNLHTYNAIFPPYYTSSEQLTLRWGVLEGLAGSLISPSRGLFIFTPVLLFSLYGVVLKIRQQQMFLLDYFLVITMLLHWILSSLHIVWWGGHTYGPRYFTDIVPYFIYFLIPVFQHRLTLRGARKIALDIGLMVAIAFSFFVHYQGATNWDAYLWNVGPVPIEQKLWQWHDFQFLQGL